jgi:multidrug efflux pump subunit AcrA (membrane-fusion protein)
MEYFFMKTPSNQPIRTRMFFKPLLVGLSLLFSLLFLQTLQAAEIIFVGQLKSQATSVLGSSVIPKKQVSLTAQAPGRVLFLNGKVGTHFKQGAVIAEIDASALLAKRESVKAQISAAQANLYNANTQYQRELTSPKRDDIAAMPGFGFPAMMDQYMTRPMADMMGATDTDTNRHADLVSSKNAVSQANYALQQAMAQLQGINSSLRDTQTIAPFDGIIMQKMAEVGDTVQLGHALISYGYVKEMQLQADVPSGLVLGLQQGMPIIARIAGAAPIQTRIAEIHPVADPERHTVVVKFDLPANVVAYSGMYAEVMLPLSDKNAASRLVIPRTALLKGRSLPSVLLMTENSSELRLVRLGSMQPDGQLEVVSGLTAQDKIINNPPSGVASGWTPSNDANLAPASAAPPAPAPIVATPAAAIPATPPPVATPAAVTAH